MKFLHASKRKSSNQAIKQLRESLPEKNQGYFEALGKEWFKKHQNKLKFLLNNWATRRWFRWVLRIHKDCPQKANITALRPNSYTFISEGKQYTDFRTHQKFSKRLYYAFMPMWWAMHFLDWLVLDSYLPEFSFGFTTLTAYPDANPESTTVDGQLTVSTRNTWANFQALSTCGFAYPSATADTGPELTYNSGGGGFAGAHSVFGYDTSSIPGTDEISSAVLSIYHSTTFVNDGFTEKQSTIISDGNIASNTDLTTNDWPGDGTTNYASVTLASMGANSYIAFTFNASGISGINKAGVSNYGASLSSDFNNSEPTNTNASANWGQVRYADYTGTSNDPKLVVEHAPPGSTAKDALLLGVG